MSMPVARIAAVGRKCRAEQPINLAGTDEADDVAKQLREVPAST
jgi:hypothetical protein